MKQQLAPLAKGAKKGFIIGAIASFTIYACLRIILHDFDFTIGEELNLLFKTIATGGLLVALAVVSYLLAEMVIFNFATSKAFMIASSLVLLLAASFTALLKSNVSLNNKSEKYSR